ncbi:MAG: HDIG domain-containing protein [Ignavibacteria bacterium]|nr:HDIG domain-containing protein [Ignavibacteria bacterium]
MKNNFFRNIFKGNDYTTDIDLKTNIYVKILIGIITVVIVILLLPSYKTIDTEYEIGTIWSNEDLIAPFPFPIYKNDKIYEQEKKEVMENVAPVFMELKAAGNIDDSLFVFFKSIDEVLNEASDLEEKDGGGIDSEVLNEGKNTLKVQLNDEQWSRLYSFYKNDMGGVVNISYPSLKSLMAQNISELSRNKIINIDKSKITSGKISIKRENQKLQDVEEVDKVRDRSEIMRLIRNRFVPLIQDSVLQSIIFDVSNAFIKENLYYDVALTNLEIKNRVAQITKTVGIVRENERIISKHDPITEATKLKLDSYKKIRLEKIGVQDYFLQYVGKILTIVILLTLLTLFFYYIRKRVYYDNLKLALISSIILIQCFIAFVSLKLKVDYPVELLIFVPVAAILLTIIFDSRLAFYTTVIICFLVAAVRGGDYTIAFISFCGSVLALFCVRDIKNRSHIFRSFFFILAGYSVSILAIGLDRTEGTEEVLTQLLFGGINSIMSPIIAFGFLIFYEKVFRITTDITLLELTDFNHPLLKELSTKAPGTFHHSIVMGNLSSTAAESIKANSVLARVGSYYHDIGKIVKPEFFIENQLEQQSRHETLNPNMSAKIIISHVKEGIELAKKYRLPQEVIDFIPMHHGNTLVLYFYSKAKSQVDEDKENVRDYTYRYPGPKPQTKETGIVMLADTIEASTRVIESPTPKKLEDKIDEIIKKRFMEGELDECDLTLKDLTKIKQSFLKILVGIHHQRIKYPEDYEEAKEKES